LRCIFRCCGVLKVRRTPLDLRALPANFLHSRPHCEFFESIKNGTSGRKRPDAELKEKDENGSKIGKKSKVGVPCIYR
jgi:hypothetical protein